MYSAGCQSLGVARASEQHPGCRHRITTETLSSSLSSDGMVEHALVARCLHYMRSCHLFLYANQHAPASVSFGALSFALCRAAYEPEVITFFRLPELTFSVLMLDTLDILVLDARAASFSLPLYQLLQCL